MAPGVLAAAPPAPQSRGGPLQPQLHEPGRGEMLVLGPRAGRNGKTSQQRKQYDNVKNEDSTHNNEWY